MNTFNIHGFALLISLNSEISQIHTAARSRFSKYSPFVFQGWTLCQYLRQNIHTYKKNTFTQNNTDDIKYTVHFFSKMDIITVSLLGSVNLKFNQQMFIDTFLLEKETVV